MPVVDVRQNLVGESTNAFPIENSLVFDTPDGQIEGYAAVSVTLYDGETA